VAVRRAAGVELDVYAEGLGEVGDLHGAGDAQVVLRVGAEHVGAANDQEVSLGLEAAQVLGLQDRRPQPLAQPPVRLGRDPGVAVGILVPEAAGLVAGPAT